MLTYPLVLTTLLAGGTAAAVSSRSTKQEFIRAMRKHKTLDPKIMADVAKSTTSSLKKSIMDEAVMVPPGRKLEDAAAADQEDQVLTRSSRKPTTTATTTFKGLTTCMPLM